MPKGKRMGMKRTAKEWEISLAEHIGKAADKTPDVIMSLFQSHPAVMGIAVLGMSTAGIIIADNWRDQDENLTPQADRVKWHLEGLFKGVQKITELVAVVPVVTGALPLLGQFIAARKGPAKE